MVTRSADWEGVYRVAAVPIVIIEWFPKQDSDYGCQKAMCYPSQKKGVKRMSVAAIMLATCA